MYVCMYVCVYIYIYIYIYIYQSIKPNINYRIGDSHFHIVEVEPDLRRSGYSRHITLFHESPLSVRPFSMCHITPRVFFIGQAILELLHYSTNMIDRLGYSRVITFIGSWLFVYSTSSRQY